MSKGGSGKKRIQLWKADELAEDFDQGLISEQCQISVVGDCHLAPRQYGLSVRRDDFFSTLNHIFNSLSNSSAIVFPGDFFDSRKIEADTFTRALDLLKSRPRAYIFAKGNHDRALMRDELTWIEALFIALQPDKDVMFPRNMNKLFHMLGPLNDNRFLIVCTLDYAGADTEQALKNIMEKLEKYDFPIEQKIEQKIHTILCAHFGLTEYAGGPISGTISLKNPVFVEARQTFDAIFLGHIHKQYIVPAENVEKDLCAVYGLGSIETLGFDEIENETTVYNVNWKDEFKVEQVKIERARKFIDVNVSVEGATSATEYYERMLREIIPHTADGWGKFDSFEKKIDFKNAIVRITLNGEVSFDRLKLNIPKIRDRLVELSNATHIIIRNRLTRKGEILRGIATNSTRGEMEKASVKTMADPAYSVHDEHLINLVVEIKDEVDKGVAPDKLFELIMSSPLMEDVVNDNKASGSD